MKVFVVLVLALMTKGAQPSPWIFQEIKPLSDDFGTVKKSNIPEIPVKDVDPTKPSIHIKEDIRDDILGKNKSTAKFKEGVEKLLDFLEAGPKAAGDAPENDAAQSSKTNNSKVTDSNAGKNASNFVKQHDESFSSKDKPPVFNKVNGMTANSISTENHLSSLDKDSHEESVKPLKESNSNFVNQQKEPPAIPMRSLIHSNEGLVTVPSAAKMKLHNDATGTVSQSNYGITAKSQIPYAAMTYKAPTAQLLQGNTISRSKIPNVALIGTPQRHFNPYLTSYQRSSLPYHFQTQSFNNGYILPQHANTMATQAMRYPYNQRRMLPVKSNNMYAAQKSNIRLPFYRSSAITSPVYNPRLPYAKAYNPRQSFNLFRKSALNPQKTYMSLATARARIMPHALQYPQVPRQTPYQQMPKWNLLGRNIVSKPVLPVTGMKFRRMAITDRGRAYNGISSPRDKVAQKTPLPLPLASIMTAARIVVPARPNTLNGVFKSNVETLPSADSEEKGARAV